MRSSGLSLSGSIPRPSGVRPVCALLHVPRRADWLTDVARFDSLRRLFIPDVQTPDTKPKIVGWTKKLLSEAIKADINHDGSFGKLKRLIVAMQIE